MCDEESVLERSSKKRRGFLRGEVAHSFLALPLMIASAFLRRRRRQPAAVVEERDRRERSNDRRPVVVAHTAERTSRPHSAAATSDQDRAALRAGTTIASATLIFSRCDAPTIPLMLVKLVPAVRIIAYRTDARTNFANTRR